MIEMARRITRTLTSARINTRLLERLNHLAEQLGRTRSELIDRAIAEWVDRQEQPQQQQPPKHPPRH